MGEEAEIQKRILDWLKLQTGVKMWRSNAGQRQSNVKLAPAGCPDIIGYVKEGKKKGRAIFIEVKAPGKKLSPVQVGWRNELWNARCIWMCVSSLQTVIDYFNELGI